MDRVRYNRWAAAVTLTAAAALLAGCTPAGVPALERTATPSDVLPSGVTGTTGFDTDSARHVASRDGVEYYLAKQSGDDRFAGVCLVVTIPSEPQQWASSCGSGEWFGLEWAPGHVNAEFYRHGVTADVVKPGWSRIAENVVVQD